MELIRYLVLSGQMLVLVHVLLTQLLSEQEIIVLGQGGDIVGGVTLGLRLGEYIVVLSFLEIVV